jgi:hypothetical protein
MAVQQQLAVVCWGCQDLQGQVEEAGASPQGHNLQGGCAAAQGLHSVAHCPRLGHQQSVTAIVWHEAKPFDPLMANPLKAMMAKMAKTAGVTLELCDPCKKGQDCHCKEQKCRTHSTI